MSRFEFERINLAMTSPLANHNQPGASESEPARDQCQTAAVTSLVNLTFPLLSPVSRHLILCYCYRQRTVSIVVSAMAVFRLVDNLIITNSNCDTRAQDYKEKHKLDSNQISDSAFGAHLSFCQK